MKLRTAFFSPTLQGTAIFADESAEYMERDAMPVRLETSSSQVTFRHDVLLLQGQYVSGGNVARSELIASVDPKTLMQRLTVRKINESSRGRLTTTGIMGDNAVIG